MEGASGVVPADSVTRMSERAGGVEPLPLAVDKVRKRYGEVIAVDEMSFTVDPGAFVSIVGPSGCGKSTLLEMIAGLRRPDEGTKAEMG